jgi:hypothetical protein
VTREWLGLIALNAVLLGTGLALLAGLGVVRTAAQVLRFAGLALVTGWAALGIAASFALMAGAALTVVQTVAIAALLAAAGALAARVVPARAEQGRRLQTHGAANVLAVAGVAVLLVYLEALFRRARLSEPGAWDTWAFWLPKAKSIVYFSGLDTDVGGFTSFANPDYPPLKPALDAIAFRFVGDVDPGALVVQHWLLTAAFFGALAALLAPRVRPAILWPSLAVLAVLPNFGALVGSLLADEPLALFFAVAGVCGGLWLLDRDPWLIALAGLFTAAAALVKNEGLMLALLLALLLAVVTRGRPWRELAALAAAPVGAVIPWRLWMDANGVPESPALRLGDLVDPGYLADRTDRLSTALRELPPFLLAFDRWLLTVPLALGLALVLARRRPELSVYALGTVVLGFLGFATVYWASSYPLDWYIDTSAERVVSSLAVFAAALFPLLVSEAFEQGRDPAAAPDG